MTLTRCLQLLVARKAIPGLAVRGSFREYGGGSSGFFKRNPFEHQVKNEKPKLRTKFQGPYFIREEIAWNTYKLEDEEGKEKGVWHANELKPFYPD